VYRVLLFSDILILATKSKRPNFFDCCGHILLNVLTVNDISDFDGVKNSFKLSRTDSQKTYTFYCEDRREKVVWIKELNSAISSQKASADGTRVMTNVQDKLYTQLHTIDITSKIEGFASVNIDFDSDSFVEEIIIGDKSKFVFLLFSHLFVVADIKIEKSLENKKYILRSQSHYPAIFLSIPEDRLSLDILQKADSQLLARAVFDTPDQQTIVFTKIDNQIKAYKRLIHEKLLKAQSLKSSSQPQTLIEIRNTTDLVIEVPPKVSPVERDSSKTPRSFLATSIRGLFERPK